MRKLFKSIKLYFTEINFGIFWKSLIEVTWLTMLAIFPLLVNIAIAYVTTHSFEEALRLKIIPGEILSYTLGFLAPSMYLLTKTHGSGYRLPLLHGFSLITLLSYGLIVVFYLVAKNRWVSEINMESHKLDVYFKLVLSFLALSFVLRIYSVYHGRNMSTWMQRREQQQKDFNQDFSNSLNVQ